MVTSIVWLSVVLKILGINLANISGVTVKRLKISTAIILVLVKPSY